MTGDSSKHDLLYGFLALDLEMISTPDLVAVVRDWTADAGRSLPQLLRERNLINDEDHMAVRHIVSRQLQRHKQDVDRTLAAMEIDAGLRQELSRIEHPTVQDHLKTCNLIAHTQPLAGTEHKSIAETVAMQSASESTLVPRSSPGQRFHRLRPHAKGGLGEVHVAHDRELGREVAFKQIQARFANDATCRQRFQFEAEVTGQLEHPSIVPVYSAGRDQDGAPYYAMRFIQGESLQEEIIRYHGNHHRSESERTMGLRRLINHLVDTCHAVAYAHSRGVLHRDIKPQNIMVGKFGESFVVDWGLAKRLKTAADGANAVESPFDVSGQPEATMPGSLAGTPAFMSPEQAEGRLDRLSEASDVYSLGATLYSIITGQKAFGQDSVSEILSAVRKGAFDAPRKRDRLVPRPLNAICLKAMAADPEDRYDSANRLADDLERWLAGEAVLAWPEPWTVRSRRWMSRHRTLVAASAATLVAAAVGLVAVVAVQLRANREMADANLALKTSNEDLEAAGLALADANSELGRSNAQLGDANRDLAIARDRALARSDLAIEAIEGLYLAVNDNLDVKNRPELAPLRDAILETPRVFFEDFRDELLGSDDTSPGTRLRLAQVYNQLGKVSRMISSQEGATETYREAAAILEDLLLGEPGNRACNVLLAEVYSDLGGVYHETEDDDSATLEYEKAARILESLLVEDATDIDAQTALGRVRYNQAMISVIRGELDESIASAEGGRQLLLRVISQSPDHADATNALIRMHEMLGNAYLRRGEPQVAREILEAGIPLAERAIERDSSSIHFRQSLAYIHEQLGQAHAALGVSESAMQSTRRSLEIQEQLADENPTSSHILLNLAQAKTSFSKSLFDAGEADAAITHQYEANEILEQLIDRHPTNLQYSSVLATFMLNLGTQLYMIGQKDKSIETFQNLVPVLEALVERDRSNVPRRRNLAGVHYNIGYLLSDVGRIEESLAAYQSALELRRELAAEFPDLPVLRNDIALTLGNLALLHDRREEYERALELQLEARDIQRDLVRQFPTQLAYGASLSRTLRGVAALREETGRIREAQRDYAEALAIISPPVESDPENAQHRRDLGSIYRGIGRLCTDQQDFEAAQTAFENGIDVLQRLCEDRPDETINQQRLALCMAMWTRLLVRTGRFQNAVSVADEAIELVAPMLAANSSDQSAREVYQIAYRSRAEAQARLGNADQAREDWRLSFEAAGESEDAEQDAAFVDAWMALWADDLRGASDAVERLVADGATTRQMVTAARILALAGAAEGADNPMAAMYGQRAVELLQAAAAAGPLRASQRAIFRYDYAFDGIRSREDFQRLMIED